MRAASKSRRVAGILVRPALWFCACNLLAAVLAAQCSNPTQVPNQTISSGTYNFPDNNALTASNVVINGSASVTFVAGNCIQLLPGFHATAGTAGTTFHAWVETAPAAVSVSPVGGSGLNQPFTWTVSSPSGYSNLSDMFALFNTSVSGVNACYIHYNRTSNLLYLADNTGAYWIGGFVPGSSGSAGNASCSIYGSGSSVIGSGTQLALTVSVTFLTSFSGTKNEYLIGYDNEGLNTTWLQMGTWTVPSPQQYQLTTAVNPSVGGTISLSPAGGWYNSGTFVTITATQASGYQFSGFTGSVNSGSNPVTVTMNSAMTETANFTQNPPTQYYLTTSAGTGGTISPPSGSYASGSLVTVRAGVNPAYTFTGFSGDLGGTTNPQNLTVNAPKSVTAGFAPASTVIADPSYLYVNLGNVPFSSYYDDNQHLASSSAISSSCPAGSTVRGCVRAILANLGAQAVSGIRVFVPFCAAASESQAFPNCGDPWQQVSWNPTGVPSQATWIANVGSFFQDVRDYLRPPPDPLPSVVLTFAFAPNTAEPKYLSKAQTTSPDDDPGPPVVKHPCAETPDPVYFYPLYPVGVMQDGYDIGWSDNNAYNCAPTNPYFIGWNNAFNAIDAVLGAAQGKVTVAELETQQEVNMVGFTSQLRLIYDNTNLESAGQDPNDPNNRWVDVLLRLRGLMTGRGFVPGRVNWSAPWTDSSTDISQCPINGIDTATGTCNCADVYQGYARQMALNAVAGAIGGGWVGLPSDAVFTHTGGLTCGGTDVNSMRQSPLYNTQPNIADSHMYPHVEGAGQSDTQIQAIAALDYSDLAHFLNYINPLAVTMMIGETHSGHISQGCTSYPATAAVPNVAGFNQSAIAGRSVIFQPWMNLEGSCWPYNSGGQDNYQNVNYNGNGPYTPTRN